MKKTPYRIAKMYINEVFNGTYTKEPNITVFPNERNYDEIVVSGPISVKSMCSHHFMPFYGKAYIGYLPNKNVIGVSKLSRITE
jgi:GTP cyclohydrolase I